MNTLKIAFRNIFRNSRRSLMTVMAIGVGAASLLLFGEFIENIMLALQANEVMQSGHVSVFKKGFFEFGAGNPGAFGIKDYKKILKEFSEDPEVKDLINVSTATVTLFGIAGNFETETSKTFIGIGVVPADFNKMRLWDEHHLPFDMRYREPVMSELNSTHGIVGVGMAKILGLCEKFKMPTCRETMPQTKKENFAKKTRDFSGLGESEGTSQNSDVKIDLLGGTASGAPNVVSFYIDKAVPQGVKEYDDAYIGMNIELAQQLLYGRGEKMATALVFQLHHTADIDRFASRINSIVKSKGLDLEVKALEELKPFYTQALAMFRSIFAFIAAIMAVIVLFTVVNTMSMSVMERTNEIGTLRALGVKQKEITYQFVLEGLVLGFIGSSVGVVFGSIVAQIVNHSGLEWLPAGQAEPVPLMVQTTGVAPMIFSIWLGLILMATAASWMPARKAAQLKIVDALGHV